MPQELERELREIEQYFYNAQAAYPEIARAAAQARFRYEMAKAQAVFDLENREIQDGKKKPTIPVQEAEATLMIREEKEAARYAEAELNIANKAIDNLESRLSSLQTRAKLTHIELALAR